jgi:pimeloyl-ACP methyl ester carboxylesterase
LVVPSLPGYGFSGKPTAAGWDVHRVARAWAGLMTRLSYERFLAMGSDWGTSVSISLALQDPGRLLGIHSVPPLADRHQGVLGPALLAGHRPGHRMVHHRRQRRHHRPAGCSIFPKEAPRPSRGQAERRFTNIVYWNQSARRGHFAAWEQPGLFTAEVRAAARNCAPIPR